MSKIFASGISMKRWNKKVAVVTGASTGIGAATVKGLINVGMCVAGLDICEDRVEAIKKDLPSDKRDCLQAHFCDVTNKGCVDEVFNKIISKQGPIAVLVANAGILRGGYLCTMDAKDVQDTLQTNIWGVVTCTQRAFKSMQEHKFGGHILLICSIAGQTVFRGFPNSKDSANIYSPTKFAVRAMTEIYRQEFLELGTKVKITAISPGIVETELVPGDVKKKLGKKILKSEDIADAIVYALATPPHVQIHNLVIKPIGEEVP